LRNSSPSLPFWHLTRASEAIIKHCCMPINITKGRSEQEFNVGATGWAKILLFENDNKRSLRERFEEN
jgi:hypothetical protein